jgi:hypothetical protein
MVGELKYDKGTLKFHGLAVGSSFDFYGMGKDTPCAEPTRVTWLGMLGNKAHIATTHGEVMTWEFGLSATVWADTSVTHAAQVEVKTLDNGDTVYVGRCDHGYATGFHTTESDASEVALGHGSVSRPLYEAPKMSVTEAFDRMQAVLTSIVGEIPAESTPVYVKSSPLGNGMVELTEDSGVKTLMTYAESKRLMVFSESDASTWTTLPAGYRWESNDNCGVGEEHLIAPDGRDVSQERYDAYNDKVSVPVAVGDMVKDIVKAETFTVTRADQWWIGLRQVGTWRTGTSIRTDAFIHAMADGAMVKLPAEPVKLPGSSAATISVGDMIKHYAGISNKVTDIRDDRAFLREMTSSRTESVLTLVDLGWGMDNGHYTIVPAESVKMERSTLALGPEAVYAKSATPGGPKRIEALTTTDRDMRDQVIRALDGCEAEFDVPWIVDVLQRQFGTVPIDSIPAEDFWEIVRVHGSRDLKVGSAIVPALRLLSEPRPVFIRQPIRTNLGRSKRKATRKQRARVKGGC